MTATGRGVILPPPVRATLIVLLASAGVAAQARAQAPGAAARPGSPAWTADSVIARYVVARGGEAKIHAVRTERMIGHITLASGRSGSDTVELARPLRIRTTIHLGHVLIVQGYDGATAWTINPFAGDTAPRPLDPGTAKNVIAGADMDGPLVNHAAKGERVSLAGVDTAAGRPAWALTVTSRDGTTDTWFVDTASYMITKWQGRRVINGTPLTFDTWFRAYRRVDGLMFPFRMESDTRGRPGSQRIAFDTIQVDPPIADARFRLPPPATP